LVFGGLGGCGSASPVGDAGKHDAKDGPAEAPDAAPEVVPDAPADVAPDAPADLAPDARADLAPDAGVDVPADTSPDAAAEVDPVCATIRQDATRTVHLRLTADNECDVFVNGAAVGSTTSWPSPVTLDVSLYVYPGQVNVIAVVARNTSSQGGNDRGLIGELDDLTDGGMRVVIVTDGSWRTSKVEQSGWPALLFDDSTWAAATVIANHGDGPWGALLGTSDAKWLWSGPVPASTADKPDLETAYFRKRFFFDTDGSTVTSQPACPIPLTPP
jgi:hypothetical protein